MAEIKKQTRRGVSNQTQATNQLKFHEKDATSNGLFIARLADVEVKWSIPKDGVFAGLKTPSLVFHFTSNHSDVTTLRHVYNTLFAVESNVNTIPGGKDAWKVNNVITHIKHVLDVFYLKDRALTPEEEDALVLDFVDFDEETGEYIIVEEQDVLNAYGTLFTNVANMLNGRFNLKEGEVAKPCYKDANGNYTPVWLKLLRAIKTRNGWSNVNQNEELSIPNFVGTGYLELQKPNIDPIHIRLDFVKESITPKEVNKRPTLGATDMLGGVAAPSMPGSPNPFGSPTMDNLPFSF